MRKKEEGEERGGSGKWGRREKEVRGFKITNQTHNSVKQEHKPLGCLRKMPFSVLPPVGIMGIRRYRTMGRLVVGVDDEFPSREVRMVDWSNDLTEKNSRFVYAQSRLQ